MISVMSLTPNICLVIILVLCPHVKSENSESNVVDTEEEDTNTLLSIHPPPNQPATFGWSQGIVPYFIDPDSYDDIIENRVQAAMKMIESVSCVIFEQMESRPEPEVVGFIWLHITNKENVRECVHTTYVGVGGHAILVLGYDCMKRRDIIHSLLHVLGFQDEVTHPQRDLYIRVLWQNIQPKYRSLFRLQIQEMPPKPLVEYDTMSIMHFHDRAYSLNGGATIAPLITGLLINPSDKLSQLDIMKLRLTFGHECNKRKIGNLVETCENALLKPGSEEIENNKTKVDATKDAEDSHPEDNSPEKIDVATALNSKRG